MHYLILLFLCGFTLKLTAQDVLVVTETVFLGDQASRQDPLLSLHLPLPLDSQSVTDVSFSASPSGRELTPSLYIFAWNAAALNGLDSLKLRYRLRPQITPRWDFEKKYSGDQIGVLSATSVYSLPPLDKSNFERTGYGNLRENDRAKAVSKILTTLEKRVKVTTEPQDFNDDQSLLQDLHRRLTTERRFPLLVSLMLQYYEIEHRLVSGKLLVEEQVYQNQLWVEVKVGEQWQRLPISSDTDFLKYAESFRYVTCSYDYRDYSFELFGLPKGEWRHTYKLLATDLWDRKDTALNSKQYELAIQLIDSVIGISPNSIVAISEKGLIYTAADNPMEGMKYLQRALREAKGVDKGIALIQMAKFYSMQNQVNESMEALERASLISLIDYAAVLRDPRFKNLLNDKASQRKLLRDHPEVFFPPE